MERLNEIALRKAEIKELLKSDEDVNIEEIRAELDSLEAEERAINEAVAEEQRKADEEAEERRAMAEEIVEEKPVEVKEIEIKEKKMDIEVRNTKEYIEAYANFVKTGDDKEARSLLTENATNGTLPVPTFVADIVAEAFKESKLLSRISKMHVRGDLKVPFEYDAPIATVHAEGDSAQLEEALKIGYVKIQNQTWKKWVGISDEALDNQNGEDLLRYLYSEIARGIVKAREKAVCDAILNAPQTATASAPAVAKTGSAAGALTDIIDAEALLGDGAEDIVVILSKADYATYRGLQMAATYGVDPFDGLEVIKCEYATAPIVGDLKGVMENFGRGDEEVQIKLDDKTRMKEDMVDVLGRLPSGIAVVGNKFFAKVAA